MNAIIRAATACALLSAVPATGSAQQADIVVQPPTTAAWSAVMARELERGMIYPRADFGRGEPEGVARVRFTCSDTGAPTGVTLWRSSGDRRIDQAALRAVGRIKTMHPLPAGVGHDQRYAALLVFARTEASRERQLRAVMAEPEMRRWAAMAKGRTLALVAPIPSVAGSPG